MDERVFKRINVFRGFKRTAGDYRDAVKYHIRKQRLHTRSTHGWGVVPQFSGMLQVRARSRPSMTVEVREGYAVDGRGRDMVTHGVELKALNKEDLMLPQTVFLVLRYQEKKTDYKVVEIPGFPRAKGLSRISELFTIDWTVAEPDSNKEIELCRILVTERVQMIRNARDPLSPRAGEIDMRYVPKAYICNGALFDAVRRLDLRALLMNAARSFVHMARTRDILSGLPAATACTTLAVINEANILTEEGLANCFGILADAMQEVAREVAEKDPKLARRPKFRAFARAANSAQEGLKKFLLVDANDRSGILDGVMHSQNNSMQAIFAAINPPQLWKIARTEVEPGRGIRVLDGTEWDKLKEDSNVPPLSIIVEGVEWHLIDRINVLDRSSMLQHNFAIREASDWWRSQVRLRYPDTVEIQDNGIGHEGGFAEWDVHNLVPGRPLVIVRRMDYARADYDCTVYIDGIVAGDVPCKGQDTRYRWRNWPFYIDGTFVKNRVARIQQHIDESNRDVNYFRIWCYQPI